MNHVMSLLFVAACGIVAYAGFFRLSRMGSDDTILSVRLAFWFMTVASINAIFSVTVWGHEPQWGAVLMAAAIAVVQVVTARIWASGVPERYRPPQPKDSNPERNDNFGSNYGGSS